MDVDLKTAIRRTVASGDFTRARRLWEQYAMACREEIRNGADPKATLEEARELMVWCRQITLAARAQAQMQLDNLARKARVAAAYGPASSAPPGSVRAARY
jgi:hypothetical protein